MDAKPYPFNSISILEMKPCFLGDIELDLECATYQQNPQLLAISTTTWKQVIVDGPPN